MSIRIRLTLWYTAILASILFIFCVVVYRIFTSSQDSEINRTLEKVAQDLLVTNAGERPVLFDNQRIVIPRLSTFSPSSVYVQVWDAQGNWQASSDNVEQYRIPLDAQALYEKPHQRRVHDVSIENADASLRVLTLPLGTVGGANEQLVGWLQIAMSINDVLDARKQLLDILVRGSLGGVLLSALMGALLARRALNPIDAITQTAVQITRADDLERRIPHLGPPDEVGQLAGAFNEMLERLERIFRAQRRFVADVSHELRTPLTTIRGNVDLLRRMGSIDTASLSAIQSETDRMIRLVGDLLLLAQADAGYLPIARQPVAIDALLAEIAHQTRVLAGQRLQVGLECPELEDAEPLTVLGDADRLRQLFLNLVDNAVKHTPDSGRVSLHLVRADGWVRVTVADTGTGIPPEDLPHIFERFYRAEKSRWRKPVSSETSPGVGVGLGLSIAQWIASTHHGRIEVQSELGKGSAFHVLLPLAGTAEH
jgi:two-component system OmpR family sensor kinase